MKQIEIKIKLNEDKIVTLIRTNGFDNGSISTQMEVIGILEHLKNKEMEKLQTLLRKSGRN